MRLDLPNHCAHCLSSGVHRPYVMVGGERFDSDPSPCTECIRGALGVGIGARHARASMEDFAEYHRVRELAQRDEEIDPVHSVWFAGWSLRASSWYLFGRAGVGKTHLAAAISIKLMSRAYWPAFITSRKLIDLVKASWGGDERASRAERLLGKIDDADIIVLDDLAAEHATEWVEDELTRLVDDWYCDERPLIVTSNLSPAELVDQYGERLAGRLIEMTRQFHMTGLDRRFVGRKS